MIASRECKYLYCMCFAEQSLLSRDSSFLLHVLQLRNLTRAGRGVGRLLAATALRVDCHFLVFFADVLFRRHRSRLQKLQVTLNFSEKTRVLLRYGIAFVYTKNQKLTLQN
jgi:hypothetical protein